VRHATVASIAFTMPAQFGHEKSIISCWVILKITTSIYYHRFLELRLGGREELATRVAFHHVATTAMLVELLAAAMHAPRQNSSSS